MCQVPVYLLAVVTAPGGWRDTHSQAHKLLFLSTQLGCDLLQQKFVQFRKEERKEKERPLADSEEGEKTAKKRSFLIIKPRGSVTISCFHQLRLLHSISALRQSQGVLVSPGFPKGLKLGMLQG